MAGMRDRSMKGRIVITAGLLLASAALLRGLSHGERIPPHRYLREFPRVLESWRGADSPLVPQIVNAVGVDDYLNRVYAKRRGEPVAFYIGYYQSQQTGDWVHSPKNCLPGAGWEPVSAGHLTLDVPGQPVLVNRYLVRKGLDQVFVLYWYQARGRVIASEYWGKVWLVADAITRNRTDVALVRISTSALDGEEKARDRAVEFAQTVYPHLNTFLPD
jgi:EpsI family protein